MIGPLDPRNQVVAPRLRTPKDPKDAFLIRLYDIKKEVALLICYDRPGPPVYISSRFSHHLLKELFEAAKKKATIKEVTVDGQPVTPATIARINHFVSQPGFSRPTTFRGWRKANRSKGDNGFIMWQSATAWEDFERITMLTVFKPEQTPAKTGL